MPAMHFIYKTDAKSIADCNLIHRQIQLPMIARQRNENRI